MADFTDILDFSVLLAPIEGDSPAGRDLRREPRDTSAYWQLRDVRQEAANRERALLRAGPNERVEPPDWAAVVDGGHALLAEQSKDIEAAAWMMEALLRLGGLRGLGAGAALIGQLAETFGEDLHPASDEDEPDEDPAELRMRPITGLVSGRTPPLLPPIRLLPLFLSADGREVTLSDYDSAAALEVLSPEQKERRIGEGAVDIAALEEQALRDPGALSQLRTDAADALAAWDAMDAALARVGGRSKPNLGDVRAILARIEGFARRLAPPPAEVAPAPVEVSAPQAGGSAPVAAPATVMAAAAGAIVTREDALRRLEEVAEWFRRFEPHSPLSYTLADAVRRARLPLPALLAEIVEDYGTRSQILTALGIRPPPEAEAEE